jgi:hypothetical protein
MVYPDLKDYTRPPSGFFSDDIFGVLTPTSPNSLDHQTPRLLLVCCTPPGNEKTRRE